jgi:hypothetical protein
MNEDYEAYWKIKRRNQKIIIGAVIVLLGMPILLISLRTAVVIYNAPSKIKNHDIQLESTWSVQDDSKLKNLIKSFKSKLDDFSNITWYTHKNFPLSFTGLSAVTNDQGHSYLISNFHSENWLFHTSIMVKIGDNIFESEDIPTYDKRNIHDNYTTIWETVSFTNDSLLFKMIAFNVGKKIKVRLNGQQYYHEYILNDKLKLAIRDTYDLGKLLERKGRK